MKDAVGSLYHVWFTSQNQSEVAWSSGEPKLVADVQGARETAGVPSQWKNFRYELLLTMDQVRNFGKSLELTVQPHSES